MLFYCSMAQRVLHLCTTVHWNSNRGTLSPCRLVPQSTPGEGSCFLAISAHTWRCGQADITALEWLQVLPAWREGAGEIPSHSTVTFLFYSHSADAWLRIYHRGRCVFLFLVHTYWQLKDYVSKKHLQYRKGKKDVLLVGKSPTSSIILLMIWSWSLQLSLPTCAQTQEVSEGQRAYLGKLRQVWYDRAVCLPSRWEPCSLQRSNPNPGLLPHILQASPSFESLVLKIQFVSKRNKSLGQQNECTQWGKGWASPCVLIV